jgi:predicted NBD/HSP70 family sugar kinase
MTLRYVGTVTDTTSRAPRDRADTVTTPLLRRMNAATVLDALRVRGPATGSELMADTGLSRPTVHAVCAELMERGLVAEIEGRTPSTAQPGRRPRQYVFDARAGYVLGIDMGAKKVTVQLADLRGDSVTEATRSFSHEHVRARSRLDRVRRTVDHVLTEASVDSGAVRAVAMGVPAPVDKDGHAVASQEYLPGLAGRDLRGELAAYGWTTQVENDANLALIGERWRGVAQGCDDVIELLAGYRLGSALFLGGRLVRGSAGRAGELTFLSMVDGVGNTDAIAELIEVYAGEVGGLPSGAEAVFAAARAGDTRASRVVGRVLDRIARVVAIFGTLLNPELVVIGGGVAGAGDLIVPGLEQRLPALTDAPPRLAASELGDRAVVTGAVRVALDAVEATLLDDRPEPATT